MLISDIIYFYYAMAHVVGSSSFFLKKRNIIWLIFHINEEAWTPLHAPPLVSNHIPSLEWAELLEGGWWSIGEAFVGEEGEPCKKPLFTHSSPTSFLGRFFSILGERLFMSFGVKFL